MKNYAASIQDFTSFLEEALREGSPSRLFTCYALRGRSIANFNLGNYGSAIADLDSCDKYQIKSNVYFFYPIKLAGGRPKVGDAVGDIPGNIEDAAARGEIAMAIKNYALAAQYFDAFAAAYPAKTGYVEKSALARQLGTQAPSSPVPQPTPLNGCTLYVNLC
jgi:hypothetical protein